MNFQPLSHIASTGRNSSYEVMLAYAALGLHVFPCHHPTPDGACSCRKGKDCYEIGKHPRTQNGFKDATVDLLMIERWCNKWPSINTAIRTGAISGIVALDVDPRHGGDVSLSQLLEISGPLPPTPKAVTGNGGFHYLFQHPGSRFRVKNSQGGIAPGIDVRGDGGYIIAPPSRTAQAYRWEVCLDDVPFAPLPAFVPVLQRDGESEDTESQTQSQVLRPSVSPSLCLSVNSLEDAIRTTLPLLAGQRNKCLFTFARTLKAMPEYAGKSASAMKAAVKLWHERALPVIGTKGFHDTWAEFCYGWERVKFPMGTSALSAAIQTAKVSNNPSCVRDYADSPEICLLVKVCQCLGVGNNGDFFISYREAGKILGVSHAQAGKVLAMLIADKVIELTKMGEPPHFASRYRYRGDGTTADTPSTGRSSS